MKNNWPTTKLKNFTSKIGSGITPKGGEASYWNKGIPLIRSQNVLVNQLDLTDVAYIDKIQHSKMSGSVVKPNDVLLNITGASIGRSCTVPSSVKEANVNQHVCIIRLNNEINPRFLSTYLNSWFGQKQIWSFQGGGSREGLNFQQIGSFDIPDIQRKEQDAIADLFYTWDSTIEKTERLIEAKDQFKKGLMQKLLTGQKRLKGCNENWRDYHLGDIFNERSESGNGHLSLLSITREEGVIPRGDVNRKDTSNKDKSRYIRICPGDIGYNTMRMWQGVSGLSSLEGIVSPAYTIVTPKDSIDGEFMAYLFKLPRIINLFYRYSQGLTSDTWNLKFRHFKEIKVSIPRIKEQKAITHILKTADEELNLLKIKHDAFKKQKRGLMQKLLTGQWKVKNV